MPHKSKMEKKIDDYLDGNVAAKKNNKKKVWIKGEYKELDVYRFPIHLLTFNLDNTRFEVQKLKDEKENGPIDATTPEGKERIIKLLIYDRGKMDKDAKKLITSLKKNKQLEPGIMTPDGAIIDGNRRLACLIYLDRNTSGNQFAYFDACRLPPGSEELDYFTVEADNQWAKDLKKEYDPLNKYMMLRRALRVFELSPKAIGHLRRVSTKEIEKEIAELEVMEEFLRTTEEPEDFTQIDGQTENFTEIAKQLTKYKKASAKATEIKKYKKLAFSLIKVNQETPKTTTYRDFRKMNRAFSSGTKRLISAYSKAQGVKDPEEVKEVMSKGAEKTQMQKIKKKPDNLAADLYETAKKLREERREQTFSQNCKNLLERSEAIINKILEK